MSEQKIPETPEPVGCMFVWKRLGEATLYDLFWVIALAVALGTALGAGLVHVLFSG